MTFVHRLIFAASLLLTTVGFAQNDNSFFKVLPPLDGSEPTWATEMYSVNPNVFAVEEAYNAYYLTHPFEKTIHTQNYKHWLRKTAPFVTGTGSIAIPTHAQQQQAAQQLQSQHAKAQGIGSGSGGGGSTTSSGNIWTNMGPYNTYQNNGSLQLRPTQVNIFCMDIAPSNADIMYAAAEGAGIWKSIDHGISWFLISRDESFTSAQDIKTHPLDDNIVYVASGDNIYKTTDGGTTWVLNFTAADRVEQFYIHRTQPNNVFAATEAGLYHSANDGATWTNTYPGRCWDIVAHATNPNTLFMTMSNSTAQRAELFKSVDNGSTWTLKDNGWYVPTDINNADDYGCKIGVTPADTNRIYACLIGNSKSGDNGWIGVYYSDDGADTWVNPDGIDGGPYVSGSTMGTNWFFAGYSSGYHQGWYNFDLDVSHLDPDRIWIGTIWDMESPDKGASIEYFRSTRSLAMHADVQDIEVNGSEVWIASDGGINYSNDEMQSTEIRNGGIAASTYWGFDQGWNEDTWTGGRYHNGDAVYHENFGGGKTMFMGGAETSTGYINPLYNRRTHYSDIGDKLTPDSLNQPSSNIANLSKYPNEAYTVLNSSELEFDARYADVMYLGRDETLWKSTDGGATFDSLYSFGAGARVLELELSRSNPDLIYALVRNGNGTIYLSLDGGNSFSAMLGVPSNNTSRLDFSMKPENHNHIWASSYYGANGQKIFKSTNNGASWQNKTTATLDGHRILDVLCQAGTGSDNIVYLLTDYGVFHWDENAQDWTDYSNNLPFVTRGLRFRPFYRDSKLRLSSGRGIWEAPLCVSSAPMAQPMTETDVAYCSRDTLQLDCYSVLNHAGASWAWSFSPAVSWISDATARNPRVTLAVAGGYDVTLTVTDSTGATSTKTVSSMITLDNQCVPDSIPGLAMRSTASGDHANIPDMGLLQTNTITMSAWVKPVGEQPAYSGILFNDNTSAGMNFRADNKLAYHWPGGQWWWDSGLEVDSNKWSHVAMVVTPDSITMYLNGVASTHVVTPGLVDFGTMKMGSYKGWGSRNFYGEMDEVAFWNRSLSQEEIRELRHLTLDANSPAIADLVAYYQFNQAGTSEVLDRIGSNHAVMASQAEKVVSTAPVGGGESYRTSINSAGTYALGTTGLEITVPGGTNPNGEIVATRLRLEPDSLPNSNDNTGNYWIVNNYGTGTFTALSDLAFVPSSGNPGGVPAEARLFVRTENEHINNWVNACGASSINTSYNYGAACGVTEFSQFFIQSSNDPITVTYLYGTSNQSVCDNDSVLIAGTWVSTAGSYQDTITVVPGTDSVLTINLALLASTGSSDTLSICAGDSALLGGSFQTAAGNYNDVYFAANACDSTVTTTLMLIAASTSDQSLSICEGDSIMLGGAWQTASGTFTDSYTSAAGCDSTATTTLAVLATEASSASVTLTEGDSILVGGSYQTQSGTYTDILTAANGCDSVVTTTVSVVSGVHQLSASEQITVYPNPTSGQLFVDFNFAAQLKFELYNAAGQLVKSATLSKAHSQVDLHGLAIGVYHYQLLNAGAVVGSSKIVLVD